MSVSKIFDVVLCEALWDLLGLHGTPARTVDLLPGPRVRDLKLGGARHDSQRDDIVCLL